MKHPDHAGFADRLAFLRWAWHLDHGYAPTNEEIGAAADHTGQWLTGLLKAKKAPTKGADHRALADFFGTSEDWLIYAEGPAPRIDLWNQWRSMRAKGRKTVRETNERPVPNPATSSRNRRAAPKGS